MCLLGCSLARFRDTRRRRLPARDRKAAHRQEYFPRTTSPSSSRDLDCCICACRCGQPDAGSGSARRVRHEWSRRAARNRRRKPDRLCVDGRRSHQPRRPLWPGRFACSSRLASSINCSSLESQRPSCSKQSIPGRNRLSPDQAPSPATTIGSSGCGRPSRSGRGYKSSCPKTCFAL